ncbi:MAG: class I SAM-dependent DNA methyltransferase [Candidatus Hodarchaeota archaeon]
MGTVECSNEEEMLELVINAVNKIEFYTNKVGIEVLENPLGFFFSRVIDNQITKSKRTGKEYESAIIRAAAFVIVIQLLLFILFSNKKEKTEIINTPSLETKNLQEKFNKLGFRRNFSIIFKIKIVELLPEESIICINQIFTSFSKLKVERFQTDILGKIFHGLIPYELRKFLAAYYSSNVVGEFLAYLVIKDTRNKTMDPACGSGTMLVSAYKRYRELDGSLSHKNILQKLYGFDVSVFAAQLAEINLILQNPKIKEHKCQITITDVFKYQTQNNKSVRDEKNSLKVDVLIGNPPFTRGDRLDNEYKIFLENHLRNHDIKLRYNKKYLGFYAYFLLDSIRFLNEGGTIGFVLPLSVINSSSMKPVLSFLITHFAFRYFIISDVQNTFSEECSFKEILFIGTKKHVREDYKTKFVVLKEKLSKRNIIDFSRKIEKTSDDYEDIKIRIRLIPKKMLLNTINTNWIIYFYDQTFYYLYKQILQSNAISLTNQIVKSPRFDVDRGLRAGISDFFYIPNKYWSLVENTKIGVLIKNSENGNQLNIPHHYVRCVLRKSALYKKITPEISELIVLIEENSTQDTDITEYIRWGSNKFKKDEGFESLAFKQVKKGRKIARVGITHELSLTSSAIVAYYSHNPTVMTDNFIFIRTFREKDDKIIAAYLNSSIFLLTYMILRRGKTGSLGQIFGIDMRNFYILNPKKVNDKDREDLLGIFDIFIDESDNFPPFSEQIQLAMQNKNSPRYLLDKKIIEILQLRDQPKFQKQLYEILNKEFTKFT